MMKSGQEWMRWWPQAQPWARRLVLVSMFSVASNCTPVSTQVVVNNTVEVTVTDGPQAGKAPAAIDMGDKRIRVAFNAITELLGHSVRFELDNSLLPKFDERLHEVFIEALETLVTSLEYVKRYDPESHAFASPHLKTVSWTYSPSKGAISTQLDVDDERLEVPVPADEWRLLPDSLIATVFDRAWDVEKARRYTHLAPADVPVDEHGYYLDFQRSYHRAPSGETELDKQKREIRDLRNVLGLYPRIVDADVKKKAVAFLVNSGRDVRGWLAKSLDLPGLSEPARSVHAAWIGWLNGVFSSLTDVQRREMANLLFTHSYEQAPGFGAGLDVTAIVKPRIRSWLERSLEKDRRSFDAEDGANAMIVCPYEYDRTYQRFDTPSQCNGLVYTTLSKGGKDYRALKALIESENSTALTQTAVLNILNNLGADASAELVEALWSDGRHARGALVALAGYAGWGTRSNRRSELPELSPEPFIRRIPGWWRGQPQLRAEILYLLVTLGDRYEGSVVWPRLADYLGTRLTGEEIAGFLKQGPSTIWHLRSLVRAVGDGWSRSKMLIPELERFLNHANESRGEPSPYYVTERCMEFLCITGTSQDIAALQGFLRDRVERYPSEKRNLQSFIDSPASRACPAAKATVEQVEKKAKAGVTFGD